MRCTVSGVAIDVILLVALGMFAGVVGVGATVVSVGATGATGTCKISEYNCDKCSVSEDTFN